jgi:hypothetical protein
MALFEFTDPTSGKRFEVEGPPGFSEEQARAAFEAQLNTGALVGLKSGDALNAAKQAAQGLQAAASQVMQGVGKIAGTVRGALTGAYNAVTASATALSKGLEGAYGQAKSVSQQAYTGITTAIDRASFDSFTSGINVANFAKQSTGLMPISGMSVPDVTATLSQAQKLVGQSTNQVSNTLGLGQYGLNANQLELAGYLKPGTSAKFLSNGSTQLTDVLKSPAVWTGKDSIGGLDSMLSSPSAQNLAQQTLMNNGLNSLSQLGVPVANLNPQQLAGTALNAAKSVEGAYNWATNQSLDSLTKSAMDSVAKAGEFAVNFAKSKIDDAMKGLTALIPGFDTVSRGQIDAATVRIVGNAKIPTFNYTGKPEGVTIEKVTAEYSRIDGDREEILNSVVQPALSKPYVNAAQAVQTIRALKDGIAAFQQYSSEALAEIRKADSLPDGQGSSAATKFEELRGKLKANIEVAERKVLELEIKLAQADPASIG